ncbi:MAG TPA: hypothetical protein VNW15_01115 [Rhizomicrobium sp.]|nr:hypothetical protein [Rhizomicrobium sp.]
MTHASFGRRAAAKTPQAPPPLVTKFARPAAVQPQAQPAAPSVDDEIKVWKKARGFTFPLKLLTLMASLSFGIASFALPASVTQWAQWPLYALSAASLYVGFGRRKVKPLEHNRD